MVVSQNFHRKKYWEDGFIAQHVAAEADQDQNQVDHSTWNQTHIVSND